MKIKAGSTNVSVYYYIVQDASATSPGEPVTGLLFSDIETGGSASYARQGAARTDLTLITLASASAAHADGGFILVDDTNMPGLYRCDYPDAAFATGIDQVFLQIVVASANNAVAAPILVDIDDNVDQTADHTASIADIPTVAEFNARTLIAADYYDPAADTVILGATQLADGANLDFGLIDKGTGQAAAATTFTGRAGQPDDSVVAGQTLIAFGSTQGYAQSVLIDSVSGDIFTFAAWPTGTTPTGTLTYVVLGTPTGSVNSLPSVSLNEILNTAITESTAGRIANNFDLYWDNADAQTAKIVDNVGAGAGLTSQNVRDAMKLTPTAGAPSTGSIDEHLDDVLEDTGTTIPAQITALNDVAATDIVSAGAITTLSGAVVNVDLVDTTTTNTDMRGTDSAATASALSTVDSNVDAILVDTGTTIPAQITALNDISVSDVLTTQMTEAYAADGVAPTLAQALFLIQQTIGDFAIAGTTITTKKIDGSTTAATYTLDDGTSPTSRTRTT